MLDVALSCIKRGWYVFPCAPKTKIPLISKKDGGHGYKDATLNEAQVHAWWAMCPKANVPITTGASGLCVVDIDTGVTDEAELQAWMGAHEMPLTYAVRTGRRPGFGVQLYYSGEGLQSKGWEKDGCKGDIRCATGLVMAAGSVHPHSGELYKVLWDLTVAPVPEYVKSLTAKERVFDPATSVDAAAIDDWQMWLYEYAVFNHLEMTDFEKREINGILLGIVCPWVSEHTSRRNVDSSTALGVRDGRLTFKCLHGTCDVNKRNTAALKHYLAVQNGEYTTPEPGAMPDPVIGTGLPMPKEDAVKDWREHYHTHSETENAPPVTFIIDGFLTKEAVTALASLPGHRKSLIALNVAYSICSGEPLFDYFKVANAPARVVYLCPEMGLSSFAERVKDIGLLKYVGTTFFYRTANMDILALDKLCNEELDGSLVIIDTAIRYLKGKENDSADMQIFAKEVMRLIGPGKADAVLLLHHSGKGNSDTNELTLENALRGSGELGAFIAQCWATRLQDTKDKFKSASFLTMVKQREFEPEGSFNIASGGYRDPRLRMVGMPGGDIVLTRGQFKGNLDGKDDAALAVIKSHMDVPIRDLVKLTEQLGCGRKKDWIAKHKKLLATGSTITEE